MSVKILQKLKLFTFAKLPARYWQKHANLFSPTVLVQFWTPVDVWTLLSSSSHWSSRQMYPGLTVKSKTESRSLFKKCSNFNVCLLTWFLYLCPDVIQTFFSTEKLFTVLPTFTHYWDTSNEIGIFLNAKLESYNLLHITDSILRQ